MQPQPAPAPPEERGPLGGGTGPRLERPIPRLRTGPVVELFGGYGYARFGSGGNGTGLNGGLASFGWNIKPWLQMVGDNSYNLVTVSGTKNVLYGNHFGLRLFRRGRDRWRTTPFVEALFGGSRLDSTFSGVTASDNGFSIKAGSGLDISLSQHFAMRLLDVDYYRIPFLLNSQNNYWASTGIVFRLGGGRPQ